MHQVSENNNSSNAPDRRDVMKAGAGALAALAGLGTVSIVRAHDATPEAAGSRNLTGYFGVTRTYVVAEDADVAELIAKVEGFVDIVSATPGFATYAVLFDETTGAFITIGLFDNQESSQASIEAAADFVVANELGNYFVDPQPTVVEGEIVISAGY